MFVFKGNQGNSSELGVYGMLRGFARWILKGDADAPPAAAPWRRLPRMLGENRSIDAQPAAPPTPAENPSENDDHTVAPESVDPNVLLAVLPLEQEVESIQRAEEEPS